MAEIVDEYGNSITLSNQQKNAIYRQAKDLREEIIGSKLTKDEHWHADERNVREFQRREGSPEMVKKVELFRKQMKAIGADPDDILLPLYRRSRATTQK